MSASEFMPGQDVLYTDGFYKSVSGVVLGVILTPDGWVYNVRLVEGIKGALNFSHVQCKAIYLKAVH